MFGTSDLNLALLLTSSASLDRSPKSNWVEKAGSLPPYIRKLARAIEKNGHPLSAAIGIAIGQVKKWAAGGEDVNADTRAKAAKALAQWEALKAKNKAKQIVKASREDEGDYLFLSQAEVPYDTAIVGTAWDRLQSEARRKVRDARRIEHAAKYGSHEDMPYLDMPYFYVQSVWTDFIIVRSEDNDLLTKIPYQVVNGHQVFFGPATLVRHTYEALPEWDDDWNISLYEDEDVEVTSEEMLLLADYAAHIFTPSTILREG